MAGVGLAATSACAPLPPPGRDGAAATASGAVDRSGSEHTLAFGNWTQYVDVDDAGHRPTLEAFQKATGIRVSYTEDIDDNDVYFNKIAPQLRIRQDIGRDLVVFTDWMVNRCITQGLVQEIDLRRMPNVTAGLLPALAMAPFDPGRRYSLPWQSGLTGIAYDRTKVKEIRSVADLWRPDLKGRVVALTEYRDTLGLIMRSQGVDPAKAFTKDQFFDACDVVARQIHDGQIRRIRGGSYIQELQSGNALAGIVWSGDIETLRTETGNDGWTFVLPESGGMLWSDNAVVPVTSHHRANAERLLDWYYRPEVAAKVAAYVGYVCPVAGAQEALAKTDPQAAKNPLVFPSDDVLTKQTSVFRALDPAEESTYAARWAQVMGD